METQHMCVNLMSVVMNDYTSYVLIDIVLVRSEMINQLTTTAKSNRVQWPEIRLTSFHHFYPPSHTILEIRLGDPPCEFNELLNNIMILTVDICKNWRPVNPQMYLWVAECDRGPELVHLRVGWCVLW